MSTWNPEWRVVTREDLTDVIYGRRRPPGFAHSPSISKLGLDAIAVAFESELLNDYSSASLILLDDRSRVETFAWLKVNAPEIFPLSQYSRVMSAADWTGISQEAFDAAGHRKKPSHADVWASVVAGEMIAQGDLDMELNQVPLSRAAGCFSLTVARAYLTFGAGRTSALCVNRLSMLEQDVRFARRHVSVKDLVLIWQLLERAGSKDCEPEIAIDMVVDCVRRQIGNSSPLEVLAHAYALHDDSFEERVVAFNQLIGKLKELPVEVRRGPTCSAVLAIAAFLVGRGTTHEFLVRRNLEFFPFGPIWFGLLAGLVGSRCWDGVWGRLTKGAERQLRSKFRWEDLSGFDLCWEEYAWYSSTFDDKSYSHIPKLLPRVLSVEVVPGASCQLRLVAVPVAPVKDVPAAADVTDPIAPPKARDETLILLEQVVRLGAAAAENIRLLAKSRKEHPSKGDKPPQASLFDKTSSSARTRSKRNKGNAQ